MASIGQVIAFALLAAATSHLASAGPLFRPSTANSVRAQLRKDYNCEHFTNEVERSECLSVMRNAVLAESHRILKRMAQSQIDASVANNGLSPQCPSYAGDYLLRDNLSDGQRSLSPYETTVTHDPNRIPAYISESRCLCKGCINPRTLTETRALNSASISVTIDVFKRNNQNHWVKSKQKIQVGCTCVVPARSSGK